MTSYDMHTLSHVIGRGLAYEFGDAVDFIGYSTDDPDGDNASSLMELRDGVSVEVFDSTGTGFVTIVAEVADPDGAITYYAGYADFYTRRERAVRDIAALVERISRGWSQQHAGTD